MKKITEKVLVGKIPDNFRINVNEIPKHEMDAMCRVILRGVGRAVKDPKFIAAYEKRLAEKKVAQGETIHGKDN